MSNGRRILPHRIRQWLRSHGLHWDCYCSLWTGNPQSTQIVQTLDNEVIAFCHSLPSICSFHRQYYLPFFLSLLIMFLVIL